MWQCSRTNVQTFIGKFWWFWIESWILIFLHSYNGWDTHYSQDSKRQMTDLQYFGPMLIGPCPTTLVPHTPRRLVEPFLLILKNLLCPLTSYISELRFDSKWTIQVWLPIFIVLGLSYLSVFSPLSSTPCLSPKVCGKDKCQWTVRGPSLGL